MSEMRTIAQINFLKIACCVLAVLLFGKSIGQVDGGPVQVEKSESVNDIEEVGLGTWLLSVFDFGDISDASDAKKAGKTSRCQGVIDELQTQKELELKVIGTLDKDCFWADVINQDPEDIGYSESGPSSMVKLHFHYYQDPAKNGVEFTANSNAKTVGVDEGKVQSDLNDVLANTPLEDEEGGVSIENHNEIVESLDASLKSLTDEVIVQHEYCYTPNNEDYFSTLLPKTMIYCGNSGFNLPDVLDNIRGEGVMGQPDPDTWDKLSYKWKHATEIFPFALNEAPQNLSFTSAEDWIAVIYYEGSEICQRDLRTIPVSLEVAPERIYAEANERVSIQAELVLDPVLYEYKEVQEDLFLEDTEVTWTSLNEIDNESSAQTTITAVVSEQLQVTSGSCSASINVQVASMVRFEYWSDAYNEWSMVPNDLIISEIGEKVKFRYIELGVGGQIGGEMSWELYGESIGSGEEVEVTFTKEILSSDQTLQLLYDGTVYANIPIWVAPARTLPPHTGYNFMDMVRLFLDGCSMPDQGIIPRCVWDNDVMGELIINPACPYMTLPFTAGIVDALYEEIKGILQLAWSITKVTAAWTPPGIFLDDLQGVRDESIAFLSAISELAFNADTRAQVVEQFWNQTKDFVIETAGIDRQAKYNQGFVVGTVGATFVPVAGILGKMGKGGRLLVQFGDEIAKVQRVILRPVMKLAQGATKYGGKVVTYGKEVGEAAKRKFRVLVLSVELYRFDGAVIRSTSWSSASGKVKHTSEMVDLVTEGGATVKSRFEVLELPNGKMVLKERYDDMIARGPPSLTGNSKFRSLPEGVQRNLFYDMDASPGLAAKLASKPDLVDAWKRLDEIGFDPELKRNPGVVEALGSTKGTRNSPSTYLTPEYISAHLAKFQSQGVASRLVLKKSHTKYGVGKPDPGKTEFVSTKSDIDKILADADGDLDKIASELGVERAQLEGDGLVRIDFDLKKKSVEIPSGNEFGTNPNWLPGGKLPDGKVEAVIETVGMVEGVDYVVTDVIF